MKTWVVQYRRKGSEEWQTATRVSTLYWDEATARGIADQSNKVDREGFEWQAIDTGSSGPGWHRNTEEATP